LQELPTENRHPVSEITINKKAATLRMFGESEMQTWNYDIDLVEYIFSDVLKRNVI
jgi:hypothetical protein